ncbi:MAG: glycine-rich domain-containing protein [Limisphaerales bacterium]
MKVSVALISRVTHIDTAMVAETLQRESEPFVPREILRSWNVQPATMERLERLERFDLMGITKGFVNKGRQFSPEQVWPIQDHFGKADLEIAILLEKEFKRFVALTMLRPKNIYAPSGPVDMYWHFFVLHTREYENFCGAIWGLSPEEVDHEEAPSRSVQGGVFPSIVPHSVLSEIDTNANRALNRLASYDLSFATEELVDKKRRFSPEQVWPIKAHFGKADKEVARLLEAEFKKFVALTLIQPGIVLAPSGPVDMYWHFLILHTRQYRRFCHEIWGRFQHHPRGSSEDEGAASDALMHHQPVTIEAETNSFCQILSLYEKIFGPADSQVWQPPDQPIE